MMIYLSWIICSLLFVLCCISLYYNFKFAKIILKMEDEIGNCLDIIDEKYRSLSKILEIPIFFDSPQVRKVIDDIRVARSSLLNIANKLTSIEQEVITDAKSEKSNKEKN